MNVSMLKRVRRAFNSDLVPRHVNRANQRKWVRSLRALGSRWLLARPIPRRTTP